MRKSGFFLQKRRPGRGTQETRPSRRRRRGAGEGGPRPRRRRREALRGQGPGRAGGAGGRRPPTRDGRREQAPGAVRAAAGRAGSAGRALGPEGPRSVISTKVTGPKSPHREAGAGAGGNPTSRSALKGGNASWRPSLALTGSCPVSEQSRVRSPKPRGQDKAAEEGGGKTAETSANHGNTRPAPDGAAHQRSERATTRKERRT